MGGITYAFNMNILPKMSYGVVECDIVMEVHAYHFVIQDFVIQRGIVCARPCILNKMCMNIYIYI